MAVLSRGSGWLEQRVIRCLIVREMNGFEIAQSMLASDPPDEAAVHGSSAAHRAAVGDGDEPATETIWGDFGQSTEHAASTQGQALVFEGAVYPVLRRLEREGLVCGRWVDVAEGQPRRRYYVLTPRGVTVAKRRFAPARVVIKGARA